MRALEDVWYALPLWMQDTGILLAWLAPTLVIGAAVLRGHRVGRLLGALLARFAWTNALFVGLVALSVGLGAALIAQEKALREGTARAADPFQVVVTAPGDRVAMLLATVYLRPTAAALVGGETMAALQADPRVALAAPVAFGDSHAGAPVVGTTAGFVAHLAGAPVEGRPFAAAMEAVAGAAAPVALGEVFAPAHGHGALAEEGAHAGAEIRVVGRLAPTGTPWDRAILVPVEAVWAVHGLATGHPPEATAALGPPFDPAYFPGTPAIVVTGERLVDAYAIQARYSDDETMAFFPGAVLATLHGLLGDVREAMSLMAVLTQALVAAGVLAGLVALARLFARRFALLRALGAPRRFVLGLVWAYATALIGAGCLLGLGLGQGAASLLSGVVTARTDIAVSPRIGFAEAQLAAGFLSLASVLALLPALAAYRRPVVDDLRSG